MNHIVLNALAGVLLLATPLLSANQAALGSTFPNNLQVEGWQGGPPGVGLPGLDGALQAREACRSGKGPVRPQAAESGVREDDPFTWTDVGYYDLNVEVFQGGNSLSGYVIIRLASRVDDLQEIRLNAAQNLDLGVLLLDGDQIPYTHVDDQVLIPLDNPLGLGQEADLELYFTTTFNGCGVLSTWRSNVQTGQSVHTITTQAEPFDARCWWPCKDDTRDKADSLRLSVTTDDFNTVVSNGVLRSDLEHGNGTHTVTWFERWPIETYLVSLCVTEYNHMEEVWNWEDLQMPMHDWSWGLSTGDQQFVLDAGLSALTALSTAYGRYPFADEKYGHAQYTWGGAMEHQTCTSMGFYNEAVVAHELSHQWFGDKITCDTFHHIWLNEGWATYSEAVYFEQLLGPDALHEYMDYEEYYGAGTIYVENPATDNIFDGNLSYAKGGWVVHMLRHVMGEDAFWAAVHAYLGPNEREYHRTATTEQFRAFMEAEHGSSLEWFFDQWIMGEYYPDYEYFWSATPAEAPGHYWLDLGVTQAQTPQRQTFSMPIDCRVTFSDHQETHVLTNDSPAMAYRLLLEGQPLAVELDPEDWILGPATGLATPPATNILASDLRLLDEGGQPLERLPESGAFQLAFELSNRGAESGALDVRLESTNPNLLLGDPVVRPSLAFGGQDELLMAGSTLAGIQGIVPITLTVTWQGGSLSRSWSFPAGHPQLLLVDDDGGGSYEDYYESAMQGLLDYETARADSLPTELGGYDLLIWLSGDNRRALEGEEWGRLAAYRNGGGFLVFTGQDFCEAQDPALLAAHCGVEVLDSLYDNNAVDTVQEGIFAGRRMYLFNGGAGNQTRMDVLSGLVDCMAPQAYYHNLDTGSAGEELICGEGGLLTLGFGLEGVADIGNGISLGESLAALLDWAQGVSAVEPRPDARPAATFVLSGAHPNPFNPATTLEWTATRPGHLRGGVYNLAGQLVETFPEREVGPGAGRLVWQAAGRASGLYLARLELSTADGKRHASTLKLMLLQ